MSGIELGLQRGAYQDNGASPWYSQIAVGSQPTIMKLSLDTGTNMNWVTSTQCNTHACTLPNRIRFDPGQSITFQWVHKSPLDLDYGPWGTLTANLGRDTLNMTPFRNLNPITMGLAVKYEGEKFDEVDWDGCLAMPSQGPMQPKNVNAAEKMSFLFQDLRDAGILSPSQTYFSYETDPASGTGTCTLGGLDITKADLSSMLILPFETYTITSKGKTASIDYIWCAPLHGAAFGGKQIAQNATFCLDTGSSRFKGDGTYMNTIIKLAAQLPNADLELDVGTTNGGQTGKLIVPPQVYNQKIEKGSNAGRTMPQFHELTGLTGLFLAGSILMDHLYTIYWYEEVPDGAQGTKLKPRGMIIFNRKGGPKIIQNGMTYAGDETNLIETVSAMAAAQEGN